MLLLTLVLLVILATVSYTLVAKLAAFRHRQSYMISYQTARYACDSATKYAMAALAELEPELISRPNEPDFSDVFRMSDEEYKLVLEQWALEQGLIYEPEDQLDDTNDFNDVNDYAVQDEFSADEPNDSEESIDDLLADFMSSSESNKTKDPNDPNNMVIPGPYKAKWPYIMEPVEFKIGNAKVRITVEDENAKYPIGWAMIEDKDFQREAEASFQMFCEWMDVNSVEIDDLMGELVELSEIKPFRMELKPIKVKVTQRYEANPIKGKKRRKYARPRPKLVEISVARQLGDEAKLFNKGGITKEILARNIIESDDREETVLKYLNLWGGRKVNINTAPRHVLEAVFVFGGDSVEIADRIIAQRKEKPFESVDKLRESLFGYSQSIDKCKNFITTESNMFTIRVTAQCGTAVSRTLTAVQVTKKKVSNDQKKQTDKNSEQNETNVTTIAVING